MDGPDTRSRPGLSLAVLVALTASPRPAPAGENLVWNGDFELPSDRNPPPGWSMWGAREYKVPANFARDTTDPASGRACLRLRHPAGTNGYIVTAPERPIVPRKGKAYRVSFSARTDLPGVSLFYLEGYTSIKPYRDAPSPGRFPFGAERQWKRFTFEVHEGRDFRADRARFILLAFRPTMDKGLAKTLWLDDVVAAECESDAGAGLIDPASLAPKRLEHRLQPGERLEAVVDAGRILRPATRLAAGVSFHRIAGWTRAPYDRDGRPNLHPNLRRAVREMRLPMTRFYGVGAERFPVADAIDKVARVCADAGIPAEHVVLELEDQSAASRLEPRAWAAAVRHSVAKAYGFRHWEVSNEPYTRKATAFAGPDDYVGHVKAVAAAIRAVQPEARIGVGVNPASPAWGSYVLKAAAGSYDFVAGHHYCFMPGLNEASLTDAALTANYEKLEGVLRLNALIAAYNPGRDVYQYDTEWGMHSRGAKGEAPEYVNRNANIYGTLHRAVRLIYYTREDILRGASSWEMFSRVRQPGFGVLTPDEPEKAFMIYWLYHSFIRHVGESVVAVSGSAPYAAPRRGASLEEPGAARPEGRPAGPVTPLIATLSADGATLFVVVVNGSWERTVPAAFEIRGFRPAKATAMVLTDDRKDGSPLVDRRQDFVKPFPVKLDGSRLAFDLPPHCAVFVRASR